MKKIMCKIFCSSFILLLIFSAHSFAMSRYEFDKGMKKGIEYFDKQMYYEARDEFQWFCDYNWGQMSAGQQKYALDYLGGTKQAIFKMEVNYVNPNVNYQKFKEMVLKYGEYANETNAYSYYSWFDEDTVIAYGYNISSNTVMISLIKMFTPEYNIMIATDGNELSLLSFYYDINQTQALIEGIFVPYTGTFLYNYNNFGQQENRRFCNYIEIINKDLQNNVGISLNNLGIYYKDYLNNTTAVVNSQ